MGTAGTRIHINELKPAANESEYRIHCDALEWSLADPIIINSAADIKSTADWKDRFEPFRHQVENLMRFCRRLPVTLLADDVGLGKTISAGLILSELMKRSRVSRVFVVCPKILIPQWVEELESKFGIEAFGASGSELHNFHRRTETAIVTTYHSATRILERQDPNLFDMLILDEAHKVRNLFGSQSPPKMAVAIFDALQARMFKYVLMLTATPIQNRLWDIYSLIECLAVAKGHRNPFGSPEAFANRFLADGKVKARQLNQHNAKEFRSIVGNYMFRTRRVDAKLAFPDRQVKQYSVAPTSEELKLQDLVARNIHLFNPLLQSSVLVALMSSPHALVAQLKNMAGNNSSFRSIADEAERIVSAASTPAKIREVLKIVKIAREQKDDWRLVIFTTRKETQNMIGRVLEGQGVSVGFIQGGQPTENRNAIVAFGEKMPRVNVLISTDAGAEGVNLQVANVLINYDLPWNPMIVEQRIGRVQRIGSRFSEVWVANVVHADSPEERIVARLMEKLQVISHTVGDIEAVLEATDDSNGDSLEKQIRDMVIASLKGQDMRMATARAVKSIEEAKSLFEEQQLEMDDKLGMMDDRDSDDPPMPYLEKRTPTTPLPEFVRNALQAEGATIKEKSDGLFCSSSPQAGDEEFTFDPRIWETHPQSGVFMGRAPVLYQPGKPAFERLVQRWLDRSGARINDDRLTENRMEQIAREWAEQITEAALLGHVYAVRSVEFSGNLVCRTRVANAVDSYEKLLQVSCDKVPDIELDSRHTPSAELLASRLKDKIESAIAADTDLTAFRDYYTTRLDTELKKTDEGDRRKKLENDLSPNTFTEVSGLEGCLTDRTTVDVTYSIGDSEPYSSRIVIQGGAIVDQPESVTCSITGEVVPVDCIAHCAVTGAAAMRHRLIRSDESGKLGIPDVVRTCQVSGRTVLENETAACSLTGQEVAASELATSEVSGRRAIISRTARCEFSNALLLDDEFVISDHSGKRARNDQVVELAGNHHKVHQSEATFCPYSNSWYLSEDCGISDVTGNAAYQADLRTSEKSGRTGHHSEVRVCGKTAQVLLVDEVQRCRIPEQAVDKDLATWSPVSEGWYLSEECELSDVSGQPVYTGDLRRSEKSGRKGHHSEMRTCAETGIQLLVNEVERCEFSGQDVDRDLIVACPETGLRGSSTRFQRCEESGALVAPQALMACTATGKIVRASLLAASEKSGRLALPRELVRCAVSGRILLPGETGACAISGKRVDVALLRQCGKTGEYGLKDHMVRSSLSKRYYFQKYAVTLPNGGKAGSNEVGRCFWNSAYLPRPLIGECSLTGLTFAKKLLNASGELGLLRECLDGRQRGAIFADEGFLQRFDRDTFSGVERFEWLRSKRGSGNIIFGKKSTFGLFPVWFGVFAEGDEKGLHLRGDAVLGKRSQGVWTSTQRVNMGKSN